MDEWTMPTDSAAARIDEEAHQAFLRKCAQDLVALEPPQRKQAPPAQRYVTQQQLARLCAAIGKEMRAVLDRELAKLEAKQLRLGGTWRAGQRYQENTLCTFQGGLWLALTDTETRPGSGPAWRLCVKKGDAS